LFRSTAINLSHGGSEKGTHIGIQRKRKFDTLEILIGCSLWK
jgi:hypothetical protein